MITQAWVEAVEELGGDGATAVAHADELVAAYAEPHRHYHVGVHVEAVVRDVGVLADEVGLSRRDRALTVLAACAHDVVYDGRAGDDERASAEWAAQRLRACGVPADASERVAQLVLTTAAHRADPADVAAAVLCDADLAVLAAVPDDYAAYVAAVRREYATVPDEQWRTGRTAVLSSLLAAERLYVTAPAHDRWEPAARRNVEAEIAGLR